MSKFAHACAQSPGGSAALPCSSWPPSYPTSWRSAPAPRQAPCRRLGAHRAPVAKPRRPQAQLGAAGMGVRPGGETGGKEQKRGKKKGKSKGREGRESRKEVGLSRPVINSCQAGEITRGRAKYSLEHPAGPPWPERGEAHGGDTGTRARPHQRGPRGVRELALAGTGPGDVALPPNGCQCKLWCGSFHPAVTRDTTTPPASCEARQVLWLHRLSVC